jgi:glycosyltransferase involved in cell wall biosynthesis
MWRRGYRVLRALGLEDRVVRIHLGLDVDKFVPCAPGERDAILARLLPGRAVERPLIFHPSRQKFRDPESKRGYKANDRLYAALARRARDGAKFTLVLVDRGGLDEPEAKRMLHELGIADRVIWVDMIPRHRLVQWYQAADITVESFYTGAIGGVPLESMACGTPVLMHLQTEPSPEDQGIFYDPRELYPSLPPIIEASSEDEIYRALRDHLTSPARLSEVGRAGRDWVVANSSADAVAWKFEAVYEAVLARGRQAGTERGGARMREIGGTT